FQIRLENKEAPNAEPALGTLAHCARDDNVTQHKSFSEHSRSHCEKQSLQSLSKAHQQPR
ncbi:hypothetical protein, partial [Acetobacter thailandicus]